MISNNNINYLSMEGLPWVLAAWLIMILLRPLATLVHEVGHVTPAFFLTKDDILLRVGRHGKSWKGNLGKVFWEISLINTREGFTGYNKNSLGKIKLITVVSGGIISSFIMSFTTGWQIFTNNFPTWIEIILVAWFCANSLVFLRSILPLRLKPTTVFPNGPPSDGLQLKNIILNKKI